MKARTVQHILWKEMTVQQEGLPFEEAGGRSKAFLLMNELFRAENWDPTWASWGPPVHDCQRPFPILKLNSTDEWSELTGNLQQKKSSISDKNTEYSAIQLSECGRPNISVHSD